MTSAWSCSSCWYVVGDVSVTCISMSACSSSAPGFVSSPIMITLFWCHQHHRWLHARLPHTHTNTCNCVSVCVCVAEHKPRAEAVHQNSFACLKTSGSGLSVSSWTRRCVFQCVLEKELAKAVENVRARDDDVGRAEKNKLLPENLFTALTKLSLSLCLLSSARAKTFCF